MTYFPTPRLRKLWGQDGSGAPASPGIPAALLRRRRPEPACVRELPHIRTPSHSGLASPDMCWLGACGCLAPASCLKTFPGGPEEA